MKPEIKKFLIEFIKKSKEYKNNKDCYKWNCPRIELNFCFESCPLRDLCESQSINNVIARANLAKKIIGSTQLELFDET